MTTESRELPELFDRSFAAAVIDTLRDTHGWGLDGDGADDMHDALNTVADDRSLAHSRAQDGGGAVAAFRIHGRLGATQWIDGAPPHNAHEHIGESDTIELAYTHPAAEQPAKVEGCNCRPGRGAGAPMMPYVCEQHRQPAAPSAQADLDAVMRKAKFRAACYQLKNLIEGPGCIRWADERGFRLKDTKEWVSFYTLVTAMHNGQISDPYPAAQPACDCMQWECLECGNRDDVAPRGDGENPGQRNEPPQSAAQPAGAAVEAVARVAKRHDAGGGMWLEAEWLGPLPPAGSLLYTRPPQQRSEQAENQS